MRKLVLISPAGLTPYPPKKLKFVQGVLGLVCLPFIRTALEIICALNAQSQLKKNTLFLSSCTDSSGPPSDNYKRIVRMISIGDFGRIP